MAETHRRNKDAERRRVEDGFLAARLGTPQHGRRVTPGTLPPR